MLLLLYGSHKSGKSLIVNYLISKESFKHIDYSREIFDNMIKEKTWCENYVTTLPNIEEYEIYRKRPCARLVVVYAPSNSIWRNVNDDMFYKDINLLRNGYYILNFADIPQLYDNVKHCLEKIRPSWDMYFLHIATIVSKRSNCMKGRVGCVIVKENRIISTGYNGTPSNATNCYNNGCVRCNSGAKNNELLEYCFCIHAEENALLFLGYEKAAGAILYVTTFPCQLCCRKIIQMKVKKIVYGVSYSDTDEIVTNALSKAGIETERYDIEF
ncbi:Deoxycytidine monophosphate (dCMP) deaminase [Conglomerata obtusa]